MVAEISPPTEKFEGALRYNFNKVAKNQATVLYSSHIKRDPNIREHTCKHTIQSFYDLIPNHSRTKKPVFHVSLNPHPDDNLSDEDLVKIGKEYMNRMGYGRQPFIIFKHFDIDREHIHIVSSRVDINGKKIKDNHERYKSQKITEDIEIKYDLHHKQKKEDKDLIIPEPIDYTKGDIRNKVYNVVKYILNKYNFQSVGEMNLALAPFNVQAELASHEINGRQSKGLFYYLTNEKGERVSTPPMQAYKVSRGVSYNSITKHFEKSKKNSQEKLTNIKFYIDKVLKTKPNEQEFVQRLKEEGINCIIRYSQDGSRIYGITFLSDDIGIVTNGSRLGKEYSANSLNKLFNEQPVEENDNNLNINDILLETDKTINEEYSKEEYYEVEEEDSSLLLDIIPDISNNNYEDKKYQIEEDIWHRKLKRKKKKRLRK